MADQSNIQPGQMGITSTNNLANVIDFIVKQHVSRIRTTTMVKVTAVSPDGSTVDVQPLISQVDGAGNVTPHGTVYGIQVHKFSGGNGTVNVLPSVGDIGMMHSADRDMSSAIKSKAAAAPSSNRTHDFSDSVFMGGFGNVNGTPTKSLVWGPNGLTITNGSASMVLTGTGLAVTGTITATGEITAGNGGGDSVTLQQHKHSANNTAPTAGT